MTFEDNINIIKNKCLETINFVFPNILINNDNLLLNKFFEIMKRIYSNILKYDLYNNNLNFDNEKLFNDYNELPCKSYVACLLLLLPHIKDLKQLKNITNLDDLVNTNIYNKYIYDHTIINDIHSVSNNNSFNTILEYNYNLLVKTILVVKDRFYTNWYNICPILINFTHNLDTENLFVDTLNIYNTDNFENINDGISRNSHKIISFPTLFDTLYYLLNNCINNYKCPINDDDFFTILQNNINEIKELFFEGNTNKYNHLWIYTSPDNQLYIYRQFRDKDENIRSILIKLVITYLYKTGTLNEVKTSLFESDKIKYKIKDRNFRKSDLYNIKNRQDLYEELKIYDNTYNFINNKTQIEIKKDFKQTLENNIEYKRQELINHGKNIDIIEKELKEYKNKVPDIINEKSIKDHYQVGSEGTIYGLHWISQLNFFYHYLFNKVLFITGGTGVGKSTQIPKLICYATKAFSYLTNGKTICTQPRIRPTRDNMSYISKMMGILQSENEANTNIQYATGEDIKWSKYNNTSTLFKMETDGKLKASLLSNSTLKIPLNELTNEIIDEYKKYKKLYFNIYHRNYRIQINNNLSKLENLINNINIIKQNISCYDELLDKKQNMIVNNIIIDEAHEHNKNMDYIFTLLRSLLLETELRLYIITATMDLDEPIFRNYYRVISDLELYNVENNNSYYLDRHIDISEPYKDTTFDIKEYYYDEITTIEELINNSENNKNQLIINIIKKIKSNSNCKDILIFKSGSKEINKCVQLLNSTFNDMIALPYYAQMNKDLKEFIENHYKEKHTKLSKSILLNDDYEWDNVINNNDSKTYNHYIIVSTNIAEASITIDTLSHVIDDGIQKTDFFDYNTLSNKIIKIPITESSRKQRKGRVGRIAEGYVYYLYKEKLLENVQPCYEITRADNREFIFNCLSKNNIDFHLLDKKNYNFKLEENNHNILLDILKLNSINNINSNNYINYDINTLYDYEGNFYIFSPNELNVERKDILKYPYRSFNKIYDNFIDFKNIMKSYIDYGFIDNNNHKTTLGDNFSKLIINFEGNLDIQDILLLINSYLFNIIEYSIDIISIIKNINLLKNNYKDLIDIKHKINSDILFIYNIVNKYNNKIYKYYNDNNNDLVGGLFIKILNKIINNNNNDNNKDNDDIFNIILNKMNEFTTNNRYNKVIIKEYGEAFNNFYKEYLKLKNTISISLIKSFHYINLNHKNIIENIFNNIDDDKIKNNILKSYNNLNFNDLKINHKKYNIINKLSNDDKLNYLLLLSYYNLLFIQIPKEIIIDIPNFGKTLSSNYLYMNILNQEFSSIKLNDIKFDNGQHYKYLISNVNVNYYILSFSISHDLLFIHNIPNNLIIFLPNFVKHIINNINTKDIYKNNALKHIKQIINK